MLICVGIHGIHKFKTIPEVITDQTNVVEGYHFNH